MKTFNCFKNVQSNACLVILNQNIPHELIYLLWNYTSIRICADGGANHLFSLDKNLIPDFICGDLDSVDENVMKYYSEFKKCTIINVKNQDTTDFEKCIKVIDERYNDFVDQWMVMGALDGRFDHSMASINVLYSQSKPMTLFNNCGNSMVILLRKGFHELTIDHEIQGPTCGFVPFGHQAHIDTTGLLWNLSQDHPIAFGNFFSSSNGFKDSCITINAQQDVVFTIEIQKNSLPRFTSK